MRAPVVALALCLTSVAVADEPSDVVAAKARFAAGTSFFHQHRFREAVDEFLTSYRLSHAVELLYNIGACYEALDDPGRTTIYFDRYLAARPDAAERGEIEQSLYRASTRVGRLVVQAPAGAAITVDGVPLEVTAPEPVPITAGSHRVVAIVSSQATITATVEIKGGLSREVVLRPSTVENGAPQDPRPRRRLLIGVAVGAVIVAAIAVTLGIVFGAPGGTDYHAQGIANCTGSGCQLFDFGGGR
jgi:hypothetical protein